MRRQLVVGDIHDTARLRAAIREHQVDAVMHFAAWLSVGDSVRDPAGYYRNNVAGALSVLDAMVAEKVRHLVFSSTAAVFGNPIETPITESHPKQPINAYGQTKLAIEQALPHYENAYGLTSVACAISMPPARIRTGSSARITRPKYHLIPRAIDAALGRDTFRCSATTTTRRTAPVFATTSTSPTWRGAPARARRASQGGRVHDLQSRQRPSHVGQDGHRFGRAGRRPQGALHDGPAASRRSRRAVRLERAHPHELGWTPRFEDIDVIVETAWRWRDAHPHGYRKRPTALRCPG